MSIQYQPIGNTVIVETIPISNTIVTPDGGVSFGATKCTVVAIGDGDKIPKQLIVGDIVIVSDGLSAEIPGSKQRIVNAESIMAKAI